MFSLNMLYATGFFVAGHTLGWFQVNSQFVWEWWKERPFITVCIYAIPTALCYLHGAKYAYMDTGEAWAGRFLAFAASYLVFPLLTWYFLRESMFTPKTMVCVTLSFLIISIQFFWGSK